MSLEGFLHLGESHPWLFPVLIILATFVLEDPTTFAVGVLISSSKITFEMGFASLIVGIALGDAGLYGLGYLIRRGWWKSKKSFIETRTPTLALARFIPGMRTITFLSAGFSRYPFYRFMTVIAVSTVVWTTLILIFTTEITGLLSAFSPWWILGFGLSFFCLIQWLQKRPHRP